MPYTAQAFRHTLVALKGWYREAALDAEVKPSSSVNINSTGLPLTSGLCVHVTGFVAALEPYGGVMDGPGTFEVEMGCGPAHGMPLWTWPGGDDPDIANAGVAAGASAAGTGDTPPDWVPVLPPVGGGKMPALVASGGYELETTEFDDDQTYLAGQPLRAVTSNTNANAGKLTNDRGPVTNGFTSSGVIQFVGNTATVANWDTIVAFVSRGMYTNANRIPALGFWPQLVPGNR